nr:DUF3418 domain-containing protein [Herbaspirillum seropedicae]
MAWTQEVALGAHHRRSQAKLQGIKAHTQAAADMQAQLSQLVGKRFVAETDYGNLSHYPRYLKAINVRLDKLHADPARDTRFSTFPAQRCAYD